MPLMPDEKMQ